MDNQAITKQEMDEALALTTWEALTPILNKAQGVYTSSKSLIFARTEKPLHRADFYGVGVRKAEGRYWLLMNLSFFCNCSIGLQSNFMAAFKLVEALYLSRRSSAHHRRPK